MDSVDLSDLRHYHSIDRRLFFRLVITLLRDPGESLLLMAFWLWLERRTYNRIISNVLRLTTRETSIIANEGVACLNALQYANNPLHVLDGGMWLTTQVADILVQASRVPIPTMDQPVPVCGFPHPIFGSLNIVQRPLDWSLTAEYSWGWSLAIEVPEDDRTVLLTSLRGCVVTEGEIKDYFVGLFGRCFNSLEMNEYLSYNESLYAQMVMRSTSDVDQVLRGGRMVTFQINGKRVWAQKFQRPDVS